MTASSLRSRTAFFFVILFIAFSAFTADIVDLREELGILPCPYGYLDNNITTGITSNDTLEMDAVPFSRFVYRKSSIKISFLHLLPYGFRAPPSWS